MLKPTRAGLECPICQKTNGNCRIGDNNYVQCMTYTDGDYPDNGYRYIGNTKDNNWGQYVINNGLNNEEIEQYINTLEQSEWEKQGKPLSLSQIDTNLRLLINNLSLTQEHQQQLLDRGLTKRQIIDGNFASITGFQTLPDDISIKLAGVYIGQGGKKTIGYAKANDLICPIRNKDGLLIGYQKRVSNNNCKYQWAVTSEKKKDGKVIRKKVSSHLANSELPMAYYGVQSPKVLYLCDSVALKPYIAYCKHNINIAGSGGLGFFTSSHKEQLSELTKGCDRIIYCPDAGDIKNDKFWKAINNLERFILKYYPTKKLEVLWWNQTNKSNSDIDELNSLENSQYLDYNNFLSKFYNKSENHQFENLIDNSKETVTSKIKIKEPWYEECYLKLYKDQYLISDQDNLYLYNGKSYDKLEKGKVNKKIHHYVNNYLLFNEDSGEFEKPYAKPNNIPKGYNWITQKVWESANDINQGGLPLGNGILDMKIIEDKAYPQLLPHSPQRLFTFCSEVEYRPNADHKYAEELLQCLDEPYRTLFIETLATILGNKEIRNKWDRIKALILVGEGSNGKDTLREVISLLLGQTGITSCNLNHFKQADEGRAFSLARLAINPKINWASENKALYLDAIQSLKQAITGDPLFIEAKGKEGHDVELQTLFIFNSNEDPSISGNAKAIQSRFQIIPFTKVYALNPEAGELQANPKFKHDRQFLINEVCPAFLNILIKAYQRVLEQGINYQIASDYSEAVMEKGNHLKRFCRDIKLQFTGNESDKTSYKEILRLLHTWYENEELLEYDSINPEKKIWLDDDDYKFDKVVKVAHQLPKRLKKLFPKAIEKKFEDGKYLLGVIIKSVPSTSSEPKPEVGEIWEINQKDGIFTAKVLEIKTRSVEVLWTESNQSATINKSQLVRKSDK